MFPNNLNVARSNGPNFKSFARLVRAEGDAKSPRGHGPSFGGFATYGFTALRSSGGFGEFAANMLMNAQRVEACAYKLLAHLVSSEAARNLFNVHAMCTFTLGRWGWEPKQKDVVKLGVSLGFTISSWGGG